MYGGVAHVPRQATTFPIHISISGTSVYYHILLSQLCSNYYLMQSHNDSTILIFMCGDDGVVNECDCLMICGSVKGNWVQNTQYLLSSKYCNIL